MVKTELYYNTKKFIDVAIEYMLLKKPTAKLGNEVQKQFEKISSKKIDIVKALSDVRKDLEKDLDFFLDSDPAVDSKDEVIQTYPGFLAITYYRIAHLIYGLGDKIVARTISEKAHSVTGIDIHPGATIAVPFFIDHGTGIVIGATTIIGARCKMYQGVTLGAISTSNAKGLKEVKRHPTIGSDVTLYANATILGDVSIGDDVTVGANTYIREDIPSHTTVKVSSPELVFTTRSK